MVKAQGRLACSSGLQGRQASEEWGQAALGVAHWRARWGDRCRVGVGQGYRHRGQRASLHHGGWLQLVKKCRLLHASWKLKS